MARGEPHRARRALWVAAALSVLGPAAGLAEAYRLVPGDLLRISLISTQDPQEVRVDIDGQIRLTDVGSVDVADLTLDEAETHIEAAITQAGIFVDPQTNLSVVAYAPVVVSGDVSSPGRFDYLPRMSVATALGLSGGRQVGGTSQLEIDRARAEVEGQLRTLNKDITDTVVQIARYEAELTEDALPVLSPGLLAAIPAPDPVRIDRLLAAETGIIANARARASELVALWDEEIVTLEQQRNLLGQRLEVQTEIAEMVAQDLENARELQERGLQTAARLVRAEQVDADARDRMLEIETAQTAIARLIADSRVERTRFKRGRQEESLIALRTARLTLDDLLVRHARALEQQAILAGGNIATLMASDSFVVSFTILSGRPGRGRDMDVTEETMLLPGDTLIVLVDVGPVTEGG